MGHALFRWSLQRAHSNFSADCFSFPGPIFSLTCLLLEEFILKFYWCAAQRWCAHRPEPSYFFTLPKRLAIDMVTLNRKSICNVKLKCFSRTDLTRIVLSCCSHFDNLPLLSISLRSGLSKKGELDIFSGETRDEGGILKQRSRSE